ncbi:hypothetical protein [Streptomyces sp. NBC_00286]|uniref:hypothetical protein n=1 Tax=Streptomyces sp. NBC_00286 TaxID=2975701 RepID=UPI002E2A3451|nr:hypothetical protein [Streptomyces sp. NBC_00286]
MSADAGTNARACHDERVVGPDTATVGHSVDGEVVIEATSESATHRASAKV